MNINLETKTPIWTGNAYSKTDDIKSSSIIGNIRWWYEIICNSYGEKACNPTGMSNKCELSHKSFLSEILNGKTVDEALDDQKICPVCKLFGCNGWGGKIKLVVDDSGKIDIDTMKVPSRKYSKSIRVVSGKMFTGKNSLKLKFYKIKEITSKEINTLQLVIKIISEYGALGGRTSQGNGVVKQLYEDTNKSHVFKKLNGKILNKNDLINLNDFFFIKLRLIFNKDISSIINDEIGFWRCNKTSKLLWKKNWLKHGFIPIGFHVRDTIRRAENNYKLRHEIFGERGIGSKVFVSHGYRIDEKTVEVRIWGYNKISNTNILLSNIRDKINKELSKNLFESGGKYSFNMSKYTRVNGYEVIDNCLKEGVN